MKWLGSIIFVAVAAITAAHAADMPSKFLGTWCLSGFSDGDVYETPPCGDEQAAFIEITRDALHPRGKGTAPWQKTKW
jgi:hypothetical protein